MSQLDQFSTDQRDLLVALPYRVGLWMGTIDETGGDEALSAEKEAMQVMVTAFAQDFIKSEFVQVMMEETVAREAEWPQWENNLGNVPDECRTALGLVSKVIDRKEQTSFKMTLVEIATSVAMAYSEFQDHTELSYRVRAYLQAMLDKFRAMVTGEDAGSVQELLNISPIEHKALDSLKNALGLTPGQRRAAAMAD